MRTVEDLIVDLSSRAAPVKPLASPLIRFGQWFAVAAAIAIAAVAVFGPRADIGHAIGQPMFMVTAALTFAAAAFGGVAALVLVVPGAKGSPALRASALAMLAAWGSVLTVGLIGDDVGFFPDTHWPVCAIRIIGVGMIPAWMLFTMLRRAAPLRPAAAGAMAVLAAMALAAIAIQIVCPFDAPAHLIRGHYLPVLVTAGLGLWIAPRFLKL